MRKQIKKLIKTLPSEQQYAFYKLRQLQLILLLAWIMPIAFCFLGFYVNQDWYAVGGIVAFVSVIVDAYLWTDGLLGEYLKQTEIYLKQAFRKSDRDYETHLAKYSEKNER